jgi:hypothetical protein
VWTRAYRDAGRQGRWVEMARMDNLHENQSRYSQPEAESHTFVAVLIELEIYIDNETRRIKSGAKIHEFI